MSGDFFGGGGSGESGPYPNAPVQQTFQPMPPGGMQALSSQLQSGYGQSDMTGYLENMYRPMEITKFFEPISTTATQIKKGNYDPIETGNPMLDSLLMGGGSGNDFFDLLGSLQGVFQGNGTLTGGGNTGSNPSFNIEDFLGGSS